MPPRLVIEVVGNTAGFERSLKSANRQATLFGRSINQAGRGAVAATASFKGLGRSVAFASSAFLGGAGLVAGLKSSVSAASNLAEQTSKTNVVFGDSAQTVKAWSRTTVTSLGLAQDQALETASSFGALLRPVGLTGSEAAKQSTKLTKLGADLASFYNTSVSDALAAVRSGLIGEAEPLRRYGVLLTEARVQAQAMADTGKTTAASLTAQEKVLARQKIIFRDSAQAQGDFARTSQGLANQQRILGANVRQLQINIGQALIPEVLNIVRHMNAWLGKSQNQKRVTDNVKSAVAGLRGVIKGAIPIVEGIANAAKKFSDFVGGAQNALIGLGTAIVGLKFRGLILGLADVGANADSARTKVGVLRGRLLALSGLVLAPVVIPVLLKASSDANKARAEGKDNFDRKGIIHALTHPLQDIGAALNVFTGNQGPKNVDTLPKHLKRSRADVAALFMLINAGALTKQQLDAQRPFLTSADYLALFHHLREQQRVFGISGSGTAGSLPSPKPPKRGSAGLSRVLRNQLALSQARTPGQELAALAEQRSILANQIRSVTRRLKTAKGERAADLAKQLIQLNDQDAAALAQITSINEASAREAEAAAKRVRDAARRRLKAQQDALRASITGAFGNARLGVQGRELSVRTGKFTQAQIDAARRKQVEAAKRAIENQRRAVENQRRQEQAAQFRALGLTGTGQERVPFAATLRRQAEQLSQAIKGTPLDTDKNRNVLSRITDVLSGENKRLGKVTEDTRRTIKDLIDAIRDPLKDADRSDVSKSLFRHLSPNKLARQLGLGDDRDSIRRAAAVLSVVGRGGTVPAGRSLAFSGSGGINFNGPVTQHFHGVQNLPDLERQLEKRERARAQIRRGAR